MSPSLRTVCSNVPFCYEFVVNGDGDVLRGFPNIFVHDQLSHGQTVCDFLLYTCNCDFA